ncbi:HmuY family protein [Formosa sp. 4Alg 33]|uniref:HmuY family protein n=1 Tax=Formosa sp. 4Alg 33 TaxID=3382189 RepID=UPI003D9C0565
MTRLKLKYIPIYCSILLLVFLQSCSEDNTFSEDPFVVAFSNLSANFQEIETIKDISLVYSEISQETGTVTIQIEAENAIYGIDYRTIPEASNQSITLQIQSGAVSDVIQFEKLNPFLDETTSIQFKISSIDYSNAQIQGYSTYTISAQASLGGRIFPNIGGPNEANQVFIDLSSQATTDVIRDSWDLGFYNGDAFRVAINGTIYMAAGRLNSTNIDAVTSESVANEKKQIAVGTFDPLNQAYIDAPNGNILETAIDEISDIDSENNVYLINLGYDVGSADAITGSVAIAGDARGWKKVRILKRENGYLLQYADLNDTSHQEIKISKDSNYNFSHFSFNTNTIVSVEPEKDKWDISFTVFSNIIEGAGSYGYSDFVTQNTKGDVLSYQIINSESTYEDFTLSQVNSSKFSSNQITIGSNWREIVPKHKLLTDRFYIIKDPNGNVYKLQFLAFTNNEGERGYPEFTYELLQ